MIAMLQGFAAIAALLSAAFWVRAAGVRTPRDFNVGFGGTGGSTQELTKALVEQGRWNAVAASFAALSALFQAASFALSMPSH